MTNENTKTSAGDSQFDAEDVAHLLLEAASVSDETVTGLFNDLLEIRPPTFYINLIADFLETYLSHDGPEWEGYAKELRNVSDEMLARLMRPDELMDQRYNQTMEIFGRLVVEELAKKPNENEEGAK